LPRAHCIIIVSKIKEMGSAISCVENREKASEQLIAKCREISEQNPNNRACKFALQYLDSEHAKSLSNEGETLYLISKS
jgi:hypothetical protein